MTYERTTATPGKTSNGRKVVVDVFGEEVVMIVGDRKVLRCSKKVASLLGSRLAGAAISGDMATSGGRKISVYREDGEAAVLVDGRACAKFNTENSTIVGRNLMDASDVVLPARYALPSTAAELLSLSYPDDEILRDAPYDESMVAQYDPVAPEDIGATDHLHSGELDMLKAINAIIDVASTLRDIFHTHGEQVDSAMRTLGKALADAER